MLETYSAARTHIAEADDHQCTTGTGGKSPVPGRPTRKDRSFLVEHTWTFCAFLLAYTLPGLFSHQPWKQDETYIIDIVRSMLDTGDFVVPTMAGTPFMEKPPLFYWVAGGFAKLLTPVLSFHDAARSATAFFILLACAALAWCGRQWGGRDFGRHAVLVLLGCFGMQAYGHLMLTDIALLAGIAVGFAGLPRWLDTPVRSGLVMGTGIGIGFLAKGLLAPGFFALSGILLPICFRKWRHPSYLSLIAASVAAALPWLLIWPVCLYLRSPVLFSNWLWLNNIGRFLGFAVPTLGAAHDDGFWSKNLWWITFPAAPLATLAVWRGRHVIHVNEMVQLCVTFVAVIAGVLLLSASARGGYALPLLVPLSLLGAEGLRCVSPNMERTWRWAARIGFTSMALLIWGAWAYIVFGDPASAQQFVQGQLATNLDRHLNATAAGISVLGTLAGAALMWHPVRQTAIQTWVAGVALCWLLLANLFMPWVDQVKSYKDVLGSLHSALPPGAPCISSHGLGESEQAMLDYYYRVRTELLEFQPGTACPVLLVEGLRTRPPVEPDPRFWKMIWEGARPNDTREHFWLYQRLSDASR